MKHSPDTRSISSKFSMSRPLSVVCLSFALGTCQVLVTLQRHLSVTPDLCKVWLHSSKSHRTYVSESSSARFLCYRYHFPSVVPGSKCRPRRSASHLQCQVPDSRLHLRIQPMEATSMHRRSLMNVFQPPHLPRPRFGSCDLFVSCQGF